MKKMSVFVFFSFLFVVLFFSRCKAFSFYNGDGFKTDSILMINTDTEMVVFDKNPDKRRSMASLTKIMTYIVVSENVKDIELEKVVVKKWILDLVDKEGSVAGLKDGDELTVLDLLHCLMIRSGNDAALVLANHVGSSGGIENFVNMMNKKSTEIGCTDTNFTNPDGIYSSDHYSTARDMYKITRYAMNLPYFMEICGKRRYKVFHDSRGDLENTNKMLEPSEKDYYYPYVKGIKTGWHNEAGRCLVSCAEKSGTTYVCVAMGGPEVDVNGDKIKENIAMIETKKLYDWAFKNLAVKTLIKRSDPINQIKLRYAWKKDKIILNAEENVKLVLLKDMKLDDLTLEYFCPDFVSAPVEAGDLVAKAKFSFGGNVLLEFNLVSSETVNLNFFVFIFESIRDIIFCKEFLFFIFFVILVLFTLLFGKFIKNKVRIKRVREYRMIKKDRYKCGK